MILAALLLVQADPVAALRDELVAARSATGVLQRRCAEPIRAEVARTGPRLSASPEQRARLAVGANEPVTYRSVVLKCGDRAVSFAQNWYVRSRLTPAMKTALAGDAPFGVVIRPLSPSRQTLDIATQFDDPSVVPFVLRQRALVIGGDGKPLAEVVENYRLELISMPVLKP